MIWSAELKWCISFIQTPSVKLICTENACNATLFFFNADEFVKKTRVRYLSFSLFYASPFSVPTIFLYENGVSPRKTQPESKWNEWEFSFVAEKKIVNANVYITMMWNQRDIHFCLGNSWHVIEWRAPTEAHTHPHTKKWNGRKSNVYKQHRMRIKWTWMFRARNK